MLKITKSVIAIVVFLLMIIIKTEAALESDLPLNNRIDFWSNQISEIFIHFRVNPKTNKLEMFHDAFESKVMQEKAAAEFELKKKTKPARKQTTAGPISTTTTAFLVTSTTSKSTDLPQQPKTLDRKGLSLSVCLLNCTQSAHIACGNNWVSWDNLFSRNVFKDKHDLCIENCEEKRYIYIINFTATATLLPRHC